MQAPSKGVVCNSCTNPFSKGCACHLNACLFSQWGAYNLMQAPSTSGYMEPLCKPILEVFVCNFHASPLVKGLCVNPVQAPSTWYCVTSPCKPLPLGVAHNLWKAPTFQMQLHTSFLSCRSEHFMHFLAKNFFKLDPPTPTHPCGCSWQTWHFCADQNISCNS